MADDDYEAMPETSTIGTHMMAGAAAGVMEHSIMYPIDSIKVRIIMAMTVLTICCTYYFWRVN